MLDTPGQTPVTSSISKECLQYRLLPAGAMRMNGYYADSFGRTLIWRSEYSAWKSIDHGVLVDPSASAVPAAVEAKFKAALAKLRANAQAYHIRPQTCQANPNSVAIRAMGCGFIYGTSGEDIAYADQYGSWGTVDVAANGTPSTSGTSYHPVSCNGSPCGAVSGPDPNGDYTDANGTQWAWDPAGNNGAGRWLMVAASVTAVPSALHDYVVAYNGINAQNTVMDWFLLWALGLGAEDVSGSVTLDRIAARFGARGVLALELRVLQIAEERIIAELGTDSLTNMADWEANQLAAAAGYSNAPYAAGLDAFTFDTGAADASGSLAGEQLVKVTAGGGPSGSGFLTTIDQISNANGLMSPIDIANKLGLTYTPTTIYYVNSVPVGTEMLGGIAGSQGPGALGGAMQYLPINGSVGFGASAGLGP